MIDKNVDLAIFGKCFLSYVYGTSLSTRGKKVLLVNDDRFGPGESYNQHLSLFDIKLLKRWGADLGSETLENIDQFLIENPYYAFIGKKRIRLGDSTPRNIREFARKFPHCMQTNQDGVDTDLNTKIFATNSSEEIETSFESYCEMLAERFYGQRGAGDLSTSSFTDGAPSYIRDIFNSMCEHVYRDDMDGHESTWDMRTLIHGLRGVFQKRLSFTIDRVELIHLIASFLSPCYKLNVDAINANLKREFIDAGGKERNVELREWHFHKSRPWSLLLDSFEGVILPQNIAVIGADFPGTPLEIDSTASKYRTIEARWSISNEFAERIYDEKIVGNSPEQLGSDFPMWEMTKSGSELLFKIYAQLRPGTKIEFIEEKVHNHLYSELASIFPIDHVDILSKRADFIKDTILCQRDISVKRVAKRPRILDTTVLQNPVAVKGVYYHGQLNEHLCGLSSLIVDMCTVSRKL